MRSVAVWIAVLTAALPTAASAERDPEARCNLTTISTPTLFDVPAYTLVMERPVEQPPVIEAGPLEARKRLVLARQTYSIQPKRLYLPRTLDFLDEKGRSLAKAVPLHEGAPITQWRGPQGGLRFCSIGWQDGLFGPATNYGHYLWICFEDRDSDGAFEVAFRPISKDLGLSYKQLDMPIEPPVRFAETAPAAATAPKEARNLGALDDHSITRGVVVSKVGGSSLQLEMLGPGAPGEKDERRVELPIGQSGTATLGGITVKLDPAGKGKAQLSASGTFEPIEIAPACGGATWRLGRHVPMVNFTFPTW